MRKYVSRNYGNWQRYAYKVHGLNDREQLYFVRGHVKAKSWAVTTFHQGSQSYSGRFHLHHGDAGFSLSVKSSEQCQRSPETRTGPPRKSSEGSAHSNRHGRAHDDHRRASRHALPSALPSKKDDPRNQCIFLHYYKVAKSHGFSLKAIKAAAEPQGLPPGSPPSEGELVTVTDADCMSRAGESGPEFHDPVDDILAYILEHSDAETAVASDADVKALFEVCLHR
ncbi:hypothetical protein OBBRIDRAFT_527871 [Obba rivulosa]|uniref:Uncharacterized protein n=1 Tax=Obba rivulosa TaxID=1052685 RepID=A0A8E2AUS5_9APHY|nr:hypothetical protein OBBRIDRAFT_527871 [Obba rivulosa]